MCFWGVNILFSILLVSLPSFNEFSCSWKWKSINSTLKKYAAHKLKGYLLFLFLFFLPTVIMIMLFLRTRKQKCTVFFSPLLKLREICWRPIMNNRNNVVVIFFWSSSCCSSLYLELDSLHVRDIAQKKWRGRPVDPLLLEHWS